MANPIMRYFEYAHLPEHLQTISRPIGELAAFMDTALPEGAEKSAGLRKLLEAKDCLVRANLPAPVDQKAPDEAKDCPHAAPFRYCPECVENPCPIGLGLRDKT